MKKLVINGGKPLKGEVTISGAKNSTVALIPAAIIANEPVVLEGVPEIQDVDALIEILNDFNVKTEFVDGTLTIDPREMKSIPMPKGKIQSMRASYYFMGATLAKFDKSKFHEGLTDSQIKELSNARGSEEKLREKSNYVMQTHPQNDKDDKEYTYASFISSNIQSKTESNDSSIKKMIITKLRATEDKTKAFVNNRSTAYDIASVAETEFYNDYTGVTSWMIYLSNGWTIAESSIRIYDYDNNGTFQYTVEWTKNGQVMGYMMGTYYKQLNQTALKSFTMTQKGSLDNYKMSLERGKVR